MTFQGEIRSSLWCWDSLTFQSDKCGSSANASWNAFTGWAGMGDGARANTWCHGKVRVWHDQHFFRVTWRCSSATASCSVWSWWTVSISASSFRSEKAAFDSSHNFQLCSQALKTASLPASTTSPLCTEFPQFFYSPNAAAHHARVPHISPVSYFILSAGTVSIFKLYRLLSSSVLVPREDDSCPYQCRVREKSPFLSIYETSLECISQGIVYDRFILPPDSWTTFWWKGGLWQLLNCRCQSHICVLNLIT